MVWMIVQICPLHTDFIHQVRNLFLRLSKRKKLFFVTPQLEHMNSWIIRTLLRANIGVIGNQNHNYKLLNKSNLL